MSFQSILRSSKGFSLVELSVATGLVGIIVIVVAYLSDNISNVSRQSELNLSKLELVSAIGKHVKSFNGCQDLRGVTFNNNNANGVDIILRNMRIHGLREVVGTTGNANQIVEDLDIRAGKRFKNFRIDSLRGFFVNPTGIEFNQAGQNNLRKGFIRVTARIGHVNSTRKDPANPDSWINTNHQFFLPVVVRNVTGGVQIESCLTDSTLGQTCTTLGGSYDPLVGSCDNIPRNCYLQGAYSCNNPNGSNCNSGLTNPATNSRSCPDGTTIQKIGNNPTATEYYFICMGCPPVVSDPDRAAPAENENF